MNKFQREIISLRYGQWIRNNLNSDPVGGFMDVKALFSELAETDEKLKDLLHAVEESEYESEED